MSQGINADPKALNAKGDMHALADDTLHYIRNGDGTYQIYAYRRDPEEVTDLAKGAHAALAPAFDAAVARALAAPVTGDSAGHRP